MGVPRNKKGLGNEFERFANRHSLGNTSNQAVGARVDDQSTMRFWASADDEQSIAQSRVAQPRGLDREVRDLEKTDAHRYLPWLVLPLSPPPPFPPGGGKG